MARPRAGLRIALQALLWLVVTSVPAQAVEQEGPWYPASDDAMADVDAALERAAGSGRLALIVLGADWCHDSRALANRLQDEPLAGLVSRHYEVLLVDVGYLERGRDIVNRFGVPGYYATPTVLIVEPGTGRLVNADDRHQWGAAAGIGEKESMDYFGRMAEPGPEPPQPDGQLARLYDEIDAYERALARRVEEGYAVVGPMLRAYKEDLEPDGFEDRWNELSEFRAAIPDAIGKLRAEARRRVAAGDRAIRLDYPEFPPFSWQAEGG